MTNSEHFFEPYYNLDQPKMAVAKPKMQATFHYRKHNRNKMKQQELELAYEDDGVAEEVVGEEIDHTELLEQEQGS